VEEEEEEDASPPRTLQHSFEWRRNSCHFDAYLESVYAALLPVPGVFDPHGDVCMESLARLQTNDPMEVILHLLGFRHHTRGGNNTSIKELAWKMLDDKWNRSLLPPGQNGSVFHWITTIQTGSSPLVQLRHTKRISCPIHGDRTREVVSSCLFITPVQASVQQGVWDWEAKLYQEMACAVPRCNQLFPVHLEGISLPQILAIEISQGAQIGFEDIWLLGKRYSLVAAPRFGSGHYVAYVKHGRGWYLHDGIRTPKVIKECPRSSADFQRQATMYFYTQCLGS